MEEERITISDQGNIFDISYQDVMKFHGGAYPAGVALAFRGLQLVFAQLDDPVPKRGGWSFYSGLGIHGPGIIDCVEMVLRVKRDGMLLLEESYCAGKNAPEAPGGGRYYFEFGNDQGRWALFLKENILPADFLKLSKKAHILHGQGSDLTQEEWKSLRRMRSELAETIMRLSARELFLIKNAD